MLFNIQLQLVLDAGQFKTAFESAQRTNAELLGVTIPSHDEKKSETKSETTTASNAEESESPEQDDEKEETEGNKE